jgi:hypothetical protein
MPAVALTTSLPASAFADFDNLMLSIADFHGLDLESLLTPRTKKETHHA